MPFYQPLPISTYTLSLKLAERCGWWDPSVISEDWHSFLNCLFESGEEISTVSVFLPTQGDATDGDGWADAMSNRFHQVKRHAWGAEDVGYITGQLSLKPGAMRGSTAFRLGQVLHELNIAIERGFREAGIEMAFPQHEVRIRGLTSSLTIEPSDNRPQFPANEKAA